jgi:hypothetical protein
MDKDRASRGFCGLVGLGRPLKGKSREKTLLPEKNAIIFAFTRRSIPNLVGYAARIMFHARYAWLGSGHEKYLI